MSHCPETGCRKLTPCFWWHFLVRIIMGLRPNGWYRNTSLPDLYWVYGTVFSGVCLRVVCLSVCLFLCSSSNAITREPLEVSSQPFQGIILQSKRRTSSNTGAHTWWLDVSGVHVHASFVSRVNSYRGIYKLLTQQFVFSGPRRPWDEEELSALKDAFHGHGRPPTYPEIRVLQAAYPKLQSRTLAQIKSRAWAIIQLLQYRSINCWIKCNHSPLFSLSSPASHISLHP